MSQHFEDKRVLVTGAGGFIGSWLTEELLNSGANISVLVDKEGPIGNAGITHILDKVKVFYGDITEPETLKQAVKDQELVFHLAALTQVIHSFTLSKKFFDVNAIGTLHLLEEIRNSNSTEFFIFSSTDKVYGEPKYFPIDENHPLGAKSPYDASKLAADVLIDSYHQTYGTQAAKVRWSNTIGGRDANILRAVPDFVTSIMHGKPPTIHGTGNHIRDYMYVTDAVAGILAVAQNKNKTNGDAFNLGTEKPTSVIDIANMVIEKMNMKNKMKPIILGKDNSGEINKQYLSAKKAKEKLSWSPQVNLEQAVEKTVQWYTSHPEWYQIMLRVKNYWDFLKTK